MPTIWDAIYLGTGPIIDPDEGGFLSSNNEAENSSALVGNTYGSAGDPLWDHVTTITTIDNGGDPTILEQDQGDASDQIRFDIGSGLQTTVFDAGAAYSITITYQNPGLSAENVTAPIIQDTLGNLFLAPPQTAGSLQAALEKGAIQSITINGVVQDTYDGLVRERYDLSFICFGGDTRIRTPAGEVRAADLRFGDSVATLDHGSASVRWIGKRALSGDMLRVHPGLRPVRIAAGALGAGLPTRELIVSPQHRLLLRSRIAARMFGTGEVLVPAIKLVGLPGIARDDSGTPVTYVHFLCDSHEVVLAEGAPCESLHPGPEAMRALGWAARSEIYGLFPHLRDCDLPRPTARRIPRGKSLGRLLERHLKNARPLVEPRVA